MVNHLVILSIDLHSIYSSRIHRMLKGAKSQDFAPWFFPKALRVYSYIQSKIVLCVDRICPQKIQQYFDVLPGVFVS